MSTKHEILLSKLQLDEKEDIQKLYKLSVIKNIVGWNVAIDPTEDSYLAEQESENNFLKAKNSFMKKYKEHTITKQFKKTYFPLKMENDKIEFRQILWKKYLDLRKSKSNADEEYFIAFENIVNHTKLMLNKKKTNAMSLNDGSLGTQKEIMYVIEKMAKISKEKLFCNNTYVNKKLKEKEFSLEKRIW